MGDGFAARAGAPLAGMQSIFKDLLNDVDAAPQQAKEKAAMVIRFSESIRVSSRRLTDFRPR